MSPALEAAKIKALEAETWKTNLESDIAAIQLDSYEQEAANVAARPDANRVYYFLGSVTGNSVRECQVVLDRWSRRDPGEPITIILDSPGGLVYDGLALYDSIDALKRAGHEVTVFVRGMAASMGGILLQAASPGKRVVGSNAYVLIHEVSSGAAGKISEIQDEAKFAAELWDRLAGILAERSTLSKRSIKTKANRKDWWLAASETVALGFADEIG